MLKTLEGITHLLQLETGKDYNTYHQDITNYINKQQQEHPQRDKINLARHYLADKLKQHYNKRDN